MEIAGWVGRRQRVQVVGLAVELDELGVEFGAHGADGVLATVGIASVTTGRR